MSLRKLGVLALSVLSVLSAGCDHYKHLVRNDDASVSKASEPDATKEKDEVETDKITDVRSDPKKPRPFFGATRLSGAMSDEGREIERDLGIH
jgi:hypothetical protein